MTVKKDEKTLTEEKKKVSARKKPSPKKLKLLFTIVNRNKGELFTDLLQPFDINMQMLVAAHGTTKTETLQLLGLTESDKVLILSVVRSDRAGAALKMLEEKFKTVKNGDGIAFTVPMSSALGVAAYQFLSNARM